MRPSAGSEAKSDGPHRGKSAHVSQLNYRFGNCELRPGARQLIVEGKPAVVGTRAFDLLLVLVEGRGRLVTKDELFDLVWPGLVVEENNLQVQVSALRKLLGPGMIATVAGHGYRFEAELHEVDAPRLVTEQAGRHGVPTQLTSFVGREETIAMLRELLARHRCITLTGVGGIGKTRIAAELAAAVAETYAHGAWFVDLAAISDGSLVVGALASTLQIQSDPDRPVIDAIRDFVRDRAMLIVLDNCEHLLSACALLVKDLLRSGAEVTIVATSREPLHLSGEAVFAVPVLPVPDSATDIAACLAFPAIRLFCDRAADVTSGFALTPRNVNAVARICRELDGIPLAIELAAARTRALAVDAIASHLSDRFRLLKSGDVTVLPRQQTLRATIDWSHDLLTPAEGALFQQLGVFVGGFALDAVAFVAKSDEGAPQDVPELIARLVDKSLVVFDVHRDRYGMLETVRQYALEKLVASGQESHARDRHLSFYVSLGEWALVEMDGPRQMACVRRLDDERENLLLAFDHSRGKPGGGADALSMIFDYFMWFTAKDIELWHGLTLEVLGRPDTQEENVARSRALFTAGFLAYLRGRIEEGLRLSEDSARIARACGDPLALAEALYDVGLCEIALNRTDEARAHFLEGRELARGGDDPMVYASLSCGLGELYSQLGDLELADQAYLDALHEAVGNPIGNMINLFNLTRNAMALGAGEKAVDYLRQAIAIADPQIAANVALQLLHAASGLAAMREDWTRALLLHGAALAYQEKQGFVAVYVDGPFYARQIAPALEALGTGGASAVIAQGRSTDVDAAIAEAVAWIESLPQ
jgi:non-specific serine/threonine protein kinase